MEQQLVCKKCVLTSNTPGISVNDSGICNYCESYQTMQVAGENALLKILNEHKKKGAKYDAMVGLSGGRDSTYTLWKLVHDYKLKVLGIHYDNPFTSEYAKKNLELAVKKLDVDVIKWDFGPDVHMDSTIKAIKVWSKKPSSTLIPIVCAHCKNWWPTFFKYARDNGVSLIVIGSNPLETASFKKEGFGGARTYHKISNIPNVIKHIGKELVSNPGYLTLSWPLILSMYLAASHSSPYLRWRYKDISVIRLFDYIKWNEKEVLSSIQENLDWEKSQEVESSWRFDCRLDYIRRYMYQSTTGVTELRDLFSKMIREGQLTQEEAVSRLEKEDFVSIDVANDVLSKMGLTLDDINIDTENILK